VSNLGQLWSSTVQWGREVVAGTPVAATRKMYLREPSLTRTRAPRIHRFMTGGRDNIRDLTLGPVQAGGALQMPLSADELPELLLISVQGAVTPSTPSGATLARLWTFKPGSLDSVTMEWDDGARAWQGQGMAGNQLTISGAVGDENQVSLDLFGTDVVAGSMTGSLADRVPSFIEGWRTRLYIDPAGSVGLTPVPGILRNWSRATRSCGWSSWGRPTGSRPASTRSRRSP
jgi:hypothetical protein